MTSEVYYSMPNSSQTSNMLKFGGYINDVSNGLFFPVMLLVIWVIVFISSLATQRTAMASKALTFASFFTMVLSMPLVVLNLCNPMYMYLSIIFFAVGLVWHSLEYAKVT